MTGPIKVLLAATAALSIGVVGTALAEQEGQRTGDCWIKGAQRTVTNTDTGVIIEVASDDPVVVQTIQAQHDRPREGWGRRHGPRGAGRGPCRIEGAKRMVTNTDTGVTIEITSDDPAVIEAIQARAAQGPGKRPGRRGAGRGPCGVEGAERKLTNTDAGVTIEITSDDPAVVETIQARAADRQEGRGPGRGPEAGRKGHRKGCGNGHGQRHGQRHGKRHGWAHHGPPGQIEGVERTVTNTDSGVLIEISSDDPALVEVIQARHADWPAKRGPRGR